jgi:signal transduction protein with GAF and PtsI domain
MYKTNQNKQYMLREQGNNDPIYDIFDEITKAVLSKFRGVKDED